VRMCDQDKNFVHLWAKNLAAYKDKWGKISEMIEVGEDTKVAYQWSWREDDGKFIPFDPDQNLQVELGYVNQKKTGKMTASVTGDVNKNKNGFTYEIDFNKMTEVNTQFMKNFRTIIRKPIHITKNFQWQINIGGGWSLLPQVENCQVELAYFTKKVPEIQIVHLGRPMIIDFATMKEKQFGYLVDRSDGDYESNVVNINRRTTKDEKGVMMINDQDVNSATCLLVGPAKALPAGAKWLKLKIQEMTIEEKVTFDNPITPDIADELKLIGAKYDIKISHKGDAVTLNGVQMPVLQALKDVTHLARNLSNYKFSWPQDWEPQKELCELKEVRPDTDIWTSVLKTMQQTIPTAKIVKLERVQNKWQWEKYWFEKERVQRKNNVSTEKLLFHGTRTNTPNLIYDAEEGFDMRYSAAGMWGRASYFAQNASYSHGYAYKNANFFQMFYARVCIGKAHKCDSNNAIIKPPEGFDSVEGLTGNSVVHMLYTFGRAYPEFLITYTL